MSHLLNWSEEKINALESFSILSISYFLKKPMNVILHIEVFECDYFQ